MNLLSSILGSRIRVDFQRIRAYDLFVVRIQHSSPTVWQKRGDQLRMLCGLFEPFHDAFACVQEWELNTQTQEHTVRLDFLHKTAKLFDVFPLLLLIVRHQRQRQEQFAQIADSKGV